MDLTTFTYSTFLTFNSSNVTTNANTDFNIVYLAIGTTQFKLTITPKPNKHFVNNNICTLIFPEVSNPYQYSQGLNKLSPTVYTTAHCILWSTPMTSLAMSSLVDVSQTFGEFLFVFN